MFSLGVVGCVFPCIGCISVVFLRLVMSILRFVSYRRANMCIVMWIHVVCVYVGGAWGDAMSARKKRAGE